MSKKARLIIGIILMVLGVLSLMGLYLQTGMNLWTAFGVGLGASIFTIGLPCLGTFLIWGYKEKEKVEKEEINNEKIKDLTDDECKEIIECYNEINNKYKK